MKDKSNNELAREILLITEELTDRGLVPKQLDDLLEAELNNLMVINLIREILKMGE